MTEDVHIVFTAPHKLSDRITRYVTRSEVSHVFIEYPSTLWGGRWAAEATRDGVRKVVAKKARHNVCAEFYCRFDTRDGLKNVSQYLGEKYDYFGAGFFGLAIYIKRWFSVKLKSPLRSSKSQFCSEFVARFFKGSHLAGAEDWDPELASPERLYRFCKKDAGNFQKMWGSQ